jgi:uncharacterized SAM-binding protein YcdF (DUF218 family)
MAASGQGGQPATATRIKAHRRWPLFLAAILLPTIVWFGLDLTYVSVGAEDDHAAHADVIIVLGCNTLSHTGVSPCISARAGHAADLYKEGFAPVIIATGGPTAGADRPTESDVIESVLESDGVPQRAIIQENRALDTIQNMSYSQAIMRQHGWTTAVLVSEPFHIKRATLIAHDDGMTVYPSPAVNSANWSNILVKAYNVARDSLSLMLYQVKSLMGDRT